MPGVSKLTFAQWMAGIAAVLLATGIISAFSAVVAIQVSNAAVETRLANAEAAIQEVKLKIDMLDVRLATIQANLIGEVAKVSADVGYIRGWIEASELRGRIGLVEEH